MSLGAAFVSTILPTLIPYYDKTIQDLVELKDTVYALFSKGETASVNSLGARVSLRTKVNPNFGNRLEGNPFREPGQNSYQQLSVAYQRSSISGGMTDDVIDQIKDQNSFAESMAECIATDTMSYKRQQDIDFCLGDGSARRATVLSVTSGAAGGSVVVMDAVLGNRLLEQDGLYVAHDPTTGTAHGVTTGHNLTSKTDFQTTNFGGDVTSGTTWAAADIIVNRGDADGNSSWNLAIYGFTYFANDSGEYFGLSKDLTDKLRGIREPLGGNNISFSSLLRGEVRWKYRWNESVVPTMTDFTSEAQVSVYKNLGFQLRSFLQDPNSGPVKKFDGAIESISDGNREIIVDNNFSPSDWFRGDRKIVKHFVLEQPALWGKDGLQYRSTISTGVSASNGVAASPGQWKGLLSWIIAGKENFAALNPARFIWYSGCGTTGSFNGIK